MFSHFRKRAQAGRERFPSCVSGAYVNNVPGSCEAHDGSRSCPSNPIRCESDSRMKLRRIARTLGFTRQKTMRRNVIRQCLAFRLFPFIVGLPFFVNILGAGVIGIGKVRSVSYRESGQTIPISLFLVLLIVGSHLLRSFLTGTIRLPGGAYVRSVLSVAGAFIYLNVFAFVVGQVAVLNWASSLFLVQLVVPIFAMFAIMHVVKNGEQLVAALQYASLGILTGVLVATVINLLTFGLGFVQRIWVDSYHGVGIYQLYGYVPNIFATFTPILLGLVYVSDSKVAKVVFGGGLLLTIFTIFHLPSFGAILISCFGLLTFVGGARYFGVLRVPILPIVFLLLMPAVLLLILPHSLLGRSISLLFDPSSPTYRGSVEHRLGKLSTDGSSLLCSPFLGKAYHADYGSDLPGLVGTRIAKPHNQFLDIGLRAGLLALLLFVLMISVPAVACVRGLRRSRGRRDRMIGLSLLSSLVPSITIHNMILVPYVQPYSGIVLYMLGGLALSYYGIVRRFAV